jgi:hypothetical protein
MDWALHQTTVKGVNRHRFQSSRDALNAFNSEIKVVEGDICDDVCDPTSGHDNDVHYVGLTSGHRKCTVNDATALFRFNEREFQSWFLLDSELGGKVEKCDVEGDSGAWIIRSSDNKVMGQVIGMQNGKIVFTPINDIIDHIKEEFNTENVGLPKRARSKPSAVTGQMITLSKILPRNSGIRVAGSIPLTPPASPLNSPASLAPPPLSLPQSPAGSSESEAASPLTPDPSVSCSIALWEKDTWIGGKDPLIKKCDLNYILDNQTIIDAGNNLVSCST